MPAQPPAVFVVRQRFWPLWLRLTLSFQLFLLGVVVFSLTLRVVAGRPLYEADDEVGITVCFLAAAGFCLALAWYARHYHRVVLSSAGVRSCVVERGRRTERTDAWDDVTEVTSLTRLWGRWLFLTAADGHSIPVRLPVADPAGLLDAVHRFAGPAHPLAAALRDHLAEEAA